MEEMIRFSAPAAMLTGGFWALKWFRDPYPFAVLAPETPLCASFILLVLASVVDMGGVVTTVPNRALAVLILLLIITGSAVLVVSILVAYILVIGQNGNAEKTILETV
jgi:hypothetical protein